MTPRQLVPVAQTPEHRPWVGSVKWVRKAIYDGRLPFHKVGGKVLVDLTDLDEMAERGRHEVTP